MRKLLAAGLVLAWVGTFVGVTVWLARPVAAQTVMAPGEAVRTFVAGGPRVGAAVRDVMAEDLAEAHGVMVESVTADGPAAEAGLQAGDVVVEFDGERVRSVRQFVRLVQDTPAGRPVQAAVLRGGTPRTLTITPEQSGPDLNLAMPEIRREFERGLRELPRALDNFTWTTPDIPGVFLAPRGQLGVGLVPLGEQLAAHFGVEAGVLVSSVEDDSPAARAGLQAGDVITTVNGEAVENVGDVRAALPGADSGAGVAIGIVRDGRAQTLTATLPGAAAPGTGI
jgi:serine protease Do